jgi:TatA/E family protein of Tat protein translocase
LGNLGVPEILVIVVVALLVFGPNKVPEVARQVGKGMRELRRLQDSLRGDFADLLDLDDHDDEPTAPFHPTATASPPRSLGAAPRTLPGPPPAASPSRFRTPGGDRVVSVPHERPAPADPVAVTPPAPPPARVTAPSRFRPPPARPDAS